VWRVAKTDGVVRLRGHHLLCMLTFRGEGYSPRFVENFHAIVARLNAGADIVITTGPDDICAPLCAAEGADCHCYADRNQRRDEQALADLAALLGQPLQPGGVLHLTPDIIHRLRAAFTAGTTRTACAGCEWFDLCSDVAGAGYAGAVLAG